MGGQVTISTGSPRVGSTGRLFQKAQDPFQVGIHDAAWHAMLFQGAGKPGNPCGRLGRLGNRGMDEDHGAIAITHKPNGVDPVVRQPAFSMAAFFSFSLA